METDQRREVIAITDSEAIASGSNVTPTPVRSPSVNAATSALRSAIHSTLTLRTPRFVSVSAPSSATLSAPRSATLSEPRPAPRFAPRSVPRSAPWSATPSTPRASKLSNPRSATSSSSRCATYSAPRDNSSSRGVKRRVETSVAGPSGQAVGRAGCSRSRSLSRGSDSTDHASKSGSDTSCISIDESSDEDVKPSMEQIKKTSGDFIDLTRESNGRAGKCVNNNKQLDTTRYHYQLCEKCTRKMIPKKLSCSLCQKVEFTDKDEFVNKTVKFSDY